MNDPDKVEPSVADIKDATVVDHETNENLREDATVDLQKAPSPGALLRASDEVISSRCSEDASFSPSDNVRAVSPPADLVPRSDESSIPVPDPEEMKPVHVSFSCVALGLAAGCAWLRRRRLPRARTSMSKLLRAGS